MSNTAAEISAQMRAQLHVLDPDISAEPLTPERKIIDTVADVMAQGNVDSFVINYTMDIDSKVGADLDKFVSLFGFARQGGNVATGTVTFSRDSVATSDLAIPAGTQVFKPASSVVGAVYFQTTATVTMYAGTATVDAPVEALNVGASGNVSAGTIIGISSIGTSAISDVTNAVATSGGEEQETDDELRVRFKNTIFRNVAGTVDQYLALSIASRFTNKATVLGPISRFIEYLQISGAQATSQVTYSKYTYPFDYYLTDGNATDETFYAPRGVDYTFNNATPGGTPATTSPPIIYVQNSTNLPNNAVVLLEHTYCSKNSRNDPANNITNFVDVFISGNDDTNATESAVFPSSSQNFVSSPTTSAYYTGNFVRSGTNTAPTAGNRFQELLWQPVISLPSQIVIGSNTYHLGTDYWLVKDTSLYKGSRRSRDGIEWLASVAGAITTGAAFSISYVFDKLPLTVNELMDSHKQITTDVLVHSATLRYFNVYLTVMYTPGFSNVSVDQAIVTALGDFLARQQFGSVIQISDLLEIAHEVPGVDNVRLTQSTESSTYGVQEVGSDGVTLIGLPQTTDFPLNDSDLPVLNNIITTRRSQNTWSG